MQPGQTITPGSEQPETPSEPQLQQSNPSNETDIAVPETGAEQVESIAEKQAPDAPWKFNNEEQPTTEPVLPQHDPVSWTASEYIAHEKGPSWYMILGIGVIVFAGAVYLMTGELISSIVIVIMGAAFGAFATRQPQELDYVLDNTGLKVGSRTYSYAQFKSFNIVEEGPIRSITLMPLQRFMPPLSVYFAPEDEDKIATALSGHIPYEERKQDAVDRLMRKVRF